MDRSAGRVRIGRYAGVLPQLASSCGIRDRIVDRSAQFGAAQQLPELGRAGRSSVQRAALVRDDTLGWIRRGIPGHASARRRGHGFAEDPVVAVPAIVLHAAIGLLPVLAFLAALLYLDSYKLVRLRIVIAIVAA